MCTHIVGPNDGSSCLQVSTVSFGQSKLIMGLIGSGSCSVLNPSSSTGTAVTGTASAASDSGDTGGGGSNGKISSANPSTAGIFYVAPIVLMASLMHSPSKTTHAFTHTQHTILHIARSCLCF